MEDFDSVALAEIERHTQRLGRQLFEQARASQSTILQRRWWDEQLMNWSMRDEDLKVQLFRFVDVLPMLKSQDDIVDHLHEYLRGVQSRIPTPVRFALGMSRWASLTRGAVTKLVRLATEDLAKRFIAGSSVTEVLAAARRERELGRTFTLDILGEAVISDREADQFCRAYIDLIEGVAPAVKEWSRIPLLDADDLGPLPRTNVSIKLSALDCRFDPIDRAGTSDRVCSRLRELLRVARRHRAFINVDMESFEKKALTLHIVRSILNEAEFRDWADVGVVIQCYLHDSPSDLVELRDWAQRRGTPIWVRLVKGAYWDFETVHAQANDWPVPVFQQKSQSDAAFERATRFVMRNRRWLRPALGTHNIRSLAHGMAVASQADIPPNGFEIQMLYGMGDAEKEAITGMGHRMRIYMPYGDLIPGMAYLVRRLLENTSNDSFLRAGFVEHRPLEELLADPARDEIMVGTIEEHAMSHPFANPFKNEPPIDFAKDENRQRMEEALREVLTQLGAYYPLSIGGEHLDAEERITSCDPSYSNRVVGDVACGNRSHVERAIAAAKQALPEWRAVDVRERAGLVRRVAAEMRERKFELAAWQVYECGKGWREAAADVVEAIDFCEYYSAGALDLQGPHGSDVPGEQNRFEYLPRGVTAVIAPWNFPLAILTGMTTAALVTGNPVIMKPAETASVIAAKLQEIFEEQGAPPGVVNFLPGHGEEVGAALVEHPDVATIAFTGSRAVGLAINARAAEVSQGGLSFVKRVIAEMGGKNAIIVDADADLDEAVLGVMKSAFGYQGQKCSACSRAIVVGPVYDQFLARLVEATKSLVVGPAELPGTSIGPVISEEARAKIFEYIEIGRKEAREVFSADVGELSQQGWFVGPHIFADVAPGSRLAQEEIFGPVLAVVRAANLEEAIHIANQSDYALTGGCYSRNPATLDRVRREWLVGNLYLNRPITGAIVARQPFGGFKLSGVGSKAGGPDYLLQFVLPRTITENTMRRGFAPS